MAKFKDYQQNQIMLMPPSLEEKVAPDHLARYISKVVDALDISHIEQSYSKLGCHAYHPRMLLKVILYGYSIGLRSSRSLQKALREDIVFMWLAGRQEPDFRTISDFRKERLKDIGILFKQVIEICAELGMVRCGKISIDGTKIEASSSRHKVIFRKKLEKSQASYQEQIEQILKEAEAIDRQEDNLYRNKDGYTLERPCSEDEIKKALRKLERRRQGLKRRQEKLEAKAEVVDKKLEYMGEQRNSSGKTDPDATLMLMKNDSLGVGYNVQMATENQVIVGFGVFQRPADNRLLVEMIEEVKQNLGKTPEAVIADKGYCSQRNYEYLSSQGIRAAIPPHTYDHDKTMRRRGTYRSSKNLSYEKLKTRMLDFLETLEGQRMLERRKRDIEPTFGDIKHNMGFRKLLMRGLTKGRQEVGLVSIAHNLKKVKSWLETGERIRVTA